VEVAAAAAEGEEVVEDGGDDLLEREAGNCCGLGQVEKKGGGKRE